MPWLKQWLLTGQPSRNGRDEIDAEAAAAAPVRVVDADAAQAGARIDFSPRCKPSGVACSLQSSHDHLALSRSPPASGMPSGERDYSPLSSGSRG